MDTAPVLAILTVKVSVPPFTSVNVATSVEPSASSPSQPVERNDRASPSTNRIFALKRPVCGIVTVRSPMKFVVAESSMMMSRIVRVSATAALIGSSASSFSSHTANSATETVRAAVVPGMPSSPTWNTAVHSPACTGVPSTLTVLSSLS